MFSKLKPSLIYKDISTDISEHDEDYDASEWSYSGRNVFRGGLDRSYSEHNIDVYWLYDENLLRTGLAEHDSDDHSIFEVLWYYDTPFGTLLQEDGWEKTDKTLWSLMTTEAYQDTSIDDIYLKCFGKIITPEYIMNGFPELYECTECKKRSFSLTSCESMKKKIIEFSNPFFIDSSFIIYNKPLNSKLVVQPYDVSLQIHQKIELPIVPEQEPELLHDFLQEHDHLQK